MWMGQEDSADMTCPYLKEVTMVFCRAYPVKKLVPLDRVTTECRCEGDAFKACPLFAGALEQARRAAGDFPAPETTKGAAS